MNSGTTQAESIRAVAWCPTCCTSHGPDADCPGELLATGPERHGWRVTVDAPHGMESYGILVAPSGKLWRARVLTFPDALWTTPGGKGSIKFVGATPREAEAKAIEFVESFCAWQGYPRHDDLPPVESAPVKSERASNGGSSDETSPQRKLRSVPVRFGHTMPSRDATTLNVSERGMFITTQDPLDTGAAIRIQLRAEAFSVPLRGIVAWNRRRPASGRPAGMGVRLYLPPALYTNYVQKLL